MWKRKGAPFKLSGDTRYDFIFGKRGTGKSHATEIMRCEQAIRNSSIDQGQALTIMKAIAFGHDLGCRDHRRGSSNDSNDVAVEAMPDFLASLTHQE